VADLALLLLTLFWGTTFTLVKDVLAVASPGVFLSARFGLATAVLAAIALVRRDPVTRRLLRDGALLGLAMYAGFTLQTLGLAHTTPARSGFITGLSVLVVPFIARFALGRPVKAASWTGVAFAVLGLAVLTRPFGDGITADVRLGDALTFGCALAFAFQVVFTSEWSHRHALAPFVAVQVGVAFLGVLLSLPFETNRLDPSGWPKFAGTVAFTAIAMTALAFFLMKWAQRHPTAIRAALIFSLEPVAAALFSHVYGGEPLGVSEWAGGGLIVLGVVAGELGGALERGTAAELKA
jgi:drug/metabolite transporter (DMT)-like permease